MTYETDFVRWTQEQAALLRAFPREGNPLDVEHLAEEIEAAGRREVTELSILLMRLMSALIKITIAPPGDDRRPWYDEAFTLKGSIEVHLDDGLPSHVDLQPLWRRAWQTAVVILQEEGAILPPLVEHCPLSIDQLIDPEMHPNEARTIIMETIPEVHRVYW
ncbi:DUF29 domain-containing protein [Rhizobium leguminosarum]|uniref:DUF29 domain-containing protein n=1 Tax=Rhizobium leguminosarum TaxID=384 RepID=UPI001C9613B5|nr:DUF29 domain-containing protein [Rhizobium leguminosarum]MBY5819905.1 DUF29 domain-containing protein [Rhizobium leguminosarum]